MDRRDGEYDDYEYINTEKEYLNAAGTGNLRLVEQLHDNVRPHVPEPYINGEGQWEQENPKYQSKEEIQDAALLEAAKNGHFKVIEFLVDKGIQPEIALKADNEKATQWAEQYINARDMSSKLNQELPDKPSFKDIVKGLGQQTAQQQGLTQQGKRKM
ncbi:hypothetical protein [Burkholderia cenocepacia]|uniref:hypothetical protein n=1 Tax=Burkholderia cenocepacia TaxID=95486 RepID=UPI00192AB930|nr:hypothetical protein [Burkholderia cenocepacia]